MPSCPSNTTTSTWAGSRLVLSPNDRLGGLQVVHFSSEVALQHIAWLDGIDGPRRQPWLLPVQTWLLPANLAASSTGVMSASVRTGHCPVTRRPAAGSATSRTAGGIRVRQPSFYPMLPAALQDQYFSDMELTVHAGAAGDCC